MPSEDTTVCRVCGHLPAELPWGPDGRTPTFDICPVCGVEFGYEDATPQAARRYRERCLAAGGRWAHPKAPPGGRAVVGPLDDDDDGGGGAPVRSSGPTRRRPPPLR